MLVCEDADFSITVQLSLPHFTTLFRVVKEIPYLRNCLLGWSGAYLNCLLWYFLYARTFTKSWCSVGMFMIDAQIANS